MVSHPKVKVKSACHGLKRPPWLFRYTCAAPIRGTGLLTLLEILSKRIFFFPLSHLHLFPLAEASSLDINLAPSVTSHHFEKLHPSPSPALYVPFIVSLFYLNCYNLMEHMLIYYVCGLSSPARTEALQWTVVVLIWDH